MGSFDDARLSRDSVREFNGGGVEEKDEPLDRTRPLEDLSDIENSLLAGDSGAIERRSNADEDWRWRVRDSVRFVIVLSKAATAIASKPTGFCVRGTLESLLPATGALRGTVPGRVPPPAVVAAAVVAAVVRSEPGSGPGPGPGPGIEVEEINLMVVALEVFA